MTTIRNVEELPSDELFALAQRFLDGGFDAIDENEDDFLRKNHGFAHSKQICNEKPLTLILFLFKNAHNHFLKALFHTHSVEKFWIYYGIRQTCKDWNPAAKLELIEQSLMNRNPKSQINEDRFFTELFTELKPYQGLEETHAVHTVRILCELNRSTMCNYPQTPETIKRLCFLLRSEIANQEDMKFDSFGS